jgi:hypothetical protein
LVRPAKENGKTVGENDTFVTLIQLARQDPQVGLVLKSILAQPALKRISMVKALVDEMARRSAPADFVGAIAALLDDEVARKAAEML